MSLEHPLALLLLVVPAILLWLRMRADRPRAAEASSLLVWDKVSPTDTVPEKPRPPLAAWIEAAGAAILVFGMAGPWVEGHGPIQKTWIFLDSSPSMLAKNPDGRTRLQTYQLVYPPDGLGESAAGGVLYKPMEPARDVPGMFRIAAEQKDDRRGVLVTDHRWTEFPDDPPRFRTAALGASVFNAGITVASGEVLSDGRWRILLVVEVHGSKGPVEGTIQLGELQESFTVGPGMPIEFLRDLPADVSEARIRFPGDSLEADDVVSFRKAGGEPVSMVAPDDPDLVPMVRALSAAGARRIAPRDRDGVPGPKDILLRPGNSDDGLFLVFPVMKAESRELVIEARGVTTTAHSLMRDVQIDPGVTLGTEQQETTAFPSGQSGKSRTRTFLIGEGLILDEGTALASFNAAGGTKASCVMFGFVPGGSWVERDPSFVVFAKNLVDFAAGGPARIEATGVLDSRETREAAEGETFGDLRAAIEEARRPDPASRASYAFALLMIGGGVLAAAWLAMR